MPVWLFCFVLSVHNTKIQNLILFVSRTVEGTETVLVTPLRRAQCLLPKLNAVVAISKDMWAVKMCQQHPLVLNWGADNADCPV